MYKIRIHVTRVSTAYTYVVRLPRVRVAQPAFRHSLSDSGEVAGCTAVVSGNFKQLPPVGVLLGGYRQCELVVQV